MKAKIFSFLLCIILIFNTVALASCTGNVTPDTDDPTDGLPNNPGDGDDDVDDPNDESGGDTVYGPVEGIDDPGKYAAFELSKEKLKDATNEALKRTSFCILSYGGKFPGNASNNNVYKTINNTKGWWTGFWTGTLWHAYEMSDEKGFKNTALSHIDGFYKRIDEKLGVNNHDMGFLYTPSCVSAYKLTGDETAKKAAIMAADHLITRYHEESGFIQAWGNVGEEDEYRLIVDCLLNIPLLYWASEVTGDEKYADIAYTHFKTTMSVCYREDGSTYHTYYFDSKTGEPLRGATAQGAGDETTWSRGQAWGMYGPLLTYKYKQDPEALETFKKAANYYLNNLPADYVAYWDLSYNDGDFQPKDSSSAAIAVCALLEGVKYMDESDPLREVYYNAANRIMNSLIDSYTTIDVPTANGLLLHGTNSMSANSGIDEMLSWGDYFYMEALHRFNDPDWELYW